MNEKRELTIGAAAQVLGVTTATVRNWVKFYGSHLSPDATRRTGKRFTPEDIDTLRRVQQLLASGSTFEQVVEMLPAEGEIYTEPLPEDTETPFQPEPAQLAIVPIIERFQQLLETQAENHRATVQAKDELIQELRRDKERLQAEVNRLNEPWFLRLFRNRKR